MQLLVGVQKSAQTSITISDFPNLCYNCYFQNGDCVNEFVLQEIHEGKFCLVFCLPRYVFSFCFAVNRAGFKIHVPVAVILYTSCMSGFQHHRRAGSVSVNDSSTTLLYERAKRDDYHPCRATSPLPPPPRRLFTLKRKRWFLSVNLTLYFMRRIFHEILIKLQWGPLGCNSYSFFICAWQKLARQPLKCLHVSVPKVSAICLISHDFSDHFRIHTQSWITLNYSCMKYKSMGVHTADQDMWSVSRSAMFEGTSAGRRIQTRSNQSHTMTCGFRE